MTLTKVRAMAAKEVRHLLPLVFALLALEAVGLLESFFANSPDEMNWSQLSVLLDPDLASSAAIVYILIGLITAYMLFPHEQDQKTLQFLWSLPVRRWQVYVVKWTTALFVLTALITFGQLLSAWIHSFNANSISRTQFSWALWWLELGLLLGVSAIALGYGALMSYFRLFGVIGFAAIWGLTLYLSYIDASLTYLDASSLLTAEFRGSTLLLPGKTWGVHAGVALVCMITAGWLWTRHSEPHANHHRRQQRRSRVTTALSVVFAVGIIVIYASRTLAPIASDAQNDIDTRLETIDTRYYQLSFHPSDRSRAQLIQKDADILADQILQLLGVQTMAHTLADLTDQSTNHLGIAGWKKLRIQRSALYDPTQRSHVFVHESTHVLAEQAAKRRLQDHYNYTIFFNEGLAEWVSYEILGLDEQRHALRLLAALAWYRLDLRFDDFLYATSFRARFDENLIYALGEAWVSTLAQTCGTPAPGKVLHAMAREDAPQRLAGKTFWQDTLKASNCDLTAVNGRFALLMRDYRNQIDTLPDVRGAVALEPSTVKFTLQLEDAIPGTPYTVIARVRDNPEAPPNAVFSRRVTLQSGEIKEVEIARALLSGQRFQYQLGVEFLPDERAFYGRWIDEG